MVTKADVADVFVFDGIEGILFPVAPDPSAWPQIHAAWDEFMRFVTDARAHHRSPIGTRDYATIPSG